MIIAEHKEAMPATVKDGITLFTTHVRRAYPDTLDPKINSHSKLNDITACIQAYTAGADEALMLDPHGFVATCNSTHFFIVKDGDDGPEVWTSDGRFCLGGITRGNVLRMCRSGGITARETTFSLTDVYSAQEAFVTGTFAGVVPVRTVDGRTIGTGAAGPGGRAAAADVRRPGRRRRRGTHGAMSPVRVAMWSGPRNLSTAMMRSWENRRTPSWSTSRSTPPTSPAPALDHPGRDEVIASQPTDPAAAVARPARAAARRGAGALRQAHDPPPRRGRRPRLDRRRSATCC